MTTCGPLPTTPRAILVYCLLVIMAVPEPALAQSTLPFTGEQVFRGVFFGQDPVRNRLPELWQKNLFFQGTTMTQTQLAVQLRQNEAALQTAGEPDLASIVGQAAAFLENNPNLDFTPSTELDVAFRDAVIAQVNDLDPTFMTRFGIEMQSTNHVRVRSAVIEAGTLFIEAWQAVTGQTLSKSNTSLAHVVFFAGVVALVVAIAAVIATVAFIMDSHSVHPGADLLPFDQAVDLLTVRLNPSFTTNVPVGGALALSILLFLMMALVLLRRFSDGSVESAQG